MARRFNVFSLERLVNNLSVPQDGSGEQEGVNAVEDTAVAREQGSGVLDAGRTLERGLSQIAHLGGEVDDGGEDEPVPIISGKGEDGGVPLLEELGEAEEPGGHEDAAGDGANGALPGFVGADPGGEFVAAPGAADVESGDVTDPDDAEQKGDEGGAIGLLMESGQGDEGEAEIEKAKDGGGGVGHDLLDGAEEGAVDEQSEREDAEDGGGAVGPLEVDAKERAQGDEDGPARRTCTAALGEAEELPCSKGGDGGDGNGKE